MGAIGGDELARWEKTDGLGAAAGGGGGGAGKEERILVSVRLRPLNAKEIARGDPSDWECINDNTIIFRNSLPERSMYPAAYTFDRVFRCECTTKQVYEEGAKEVALSVVSGINSSIFAYGQTSSGKTYTMTGITEYTVADIYDYIQRHEERAFVLKFSAMEIYNEAVKDLLCTDNTPLRLLDDPERGTIVEKLTEEILRDWNHLKELLSMCEAQRQIGETSLNETSSRSHQILRLTIESSAREFLGKENSSTLTASVSFVDLAGSERASQALSAGTRLKEGCHINRSLLTLGTVIRKLSKGRNGHIPYRDSKLTRILQPSLGGNARTAIICTMSPAQSHIEQSRNTLLFASCAKAVVTSAQVNVVMSDKALVKHLQKELARLESELRYPGSASTTRHPEALLREKDAQIRKMEKEIKELMQQRDLAQSRLEDLLRGVGDDRASRQWEQFSQLSPSHVPFACEDVLSISESFGVADQSLDFGFTKFSSSYGSSNCNEHYFSSSYEKPKEQYASSPKHSINSPRFTGLISHVGGKGIAQDTYDDFEDHCKEVRCIEMDESSTSRSEESNSLLIEGSESLIPLTDDANKNRCQEPEFKRDTDLRPVSTDQTVVTLEQQLLNMRKTSDNLVKPYPVESSPWSSMRDLSSSKSLALTRSRSCRATLITTASSTWFQDIEQNDNTPPSSYLKDFPGRREVFPRRLFTINYSADKEMLSGEGSQASEHSPSSEVHKAQNIKSASEEDIPSFGTFVAGLKEMAQNQYQEQCTDDQETERNINEDFGVERTVKDVGLDPMMNPSESPSRWPLEFERKQQEIIELWHACNVSLVHRTYFYLLFKGDPADSIYMEVELRSLKRTFSQENLDKPAVEDGHNVSLTTSMRKLRREREGLCSKMQKRLSVEERESLYTKWGIALDSKQRRLQLARRLWTETRDVEHVRESASIVAKLIGLPEPAQALKEMFELSFTPQRINRRSYSWKHGRSSIKEQRW